MTSALVVLLPLPQKGRDQRDMQSDANKGWESLREMQREQRVRERERYGEGLRGIEKMLWLQRDKEMMKLKEKELNKIL